MTNTQVELYDPSYDLNGNRFAVTVKCENKASITYDVRDWPDHADDVAAALAKFSGCKLLSENNYMIIMFTGESHV